MGKRSRRPNPQHDPAYHALRERLKTIRENAGLTQVEFGASFKRPHTFIQKVESGDRCIDPVRFCRWCLACRADAAAELQAIVRAAKKTPPRA